MEILHFSSGISGEVIQIDAGHCRKLCPRHVSDDPGDASRPAVQVGSRMRPFLYFDHAKNSGRRRFLKKKRKRKKKVNTKSLINH